MGWSWAQFSVALVAGQDQVDGRIAPVAQFEYGPSGGQNSGGACRGEGLLGGQHVPDGLSHAAGDVDTSDLGAALATELATELAGGALVALL